MYVRDYMSTDPIVLAPEDTLRKARQLIRDHKLRRFPVVDKGSLVGMVTDRDVRQADMSSAVVQERRHLDYILDRIQMAGIMTPDPITVTPDTSLIQAAQLLLDNKIGGLPVVDEGSLVGMITETDMIRALMGTLQRDPQYRNPV